MKRLSLLLFVLFTVSVNAQECKLKGFVRYKHNDYVGYRADAGAEVYVVSTKNNHYFNVANWNAYETYAKQYVKYLMLKDDPEIPREYLFMFTKWNNSDKENLDKLDQECLDQYARSKDSFEDIALIDETGKYEFQLPYGEYYVLVISKNRDRPTLLEISGRKMLYKVTLAQASKILSVDFEY